MSNVKGHEMSGWRAPKLAAKRRQGTARGIEHSHERTQMQQGTTGD